MGDDRFVYLDGAFVPSEEARVPIFDRGFLFGDGLFETMRAWGGSVFRFDRHLDRLSRGLEVVGIPLSIPRPQLESAVERLLDMNRIQDAYIRLMVWRGEGWGVDPAGCSAARLAIIARPVVPYPRALYERGMKGVIVSIRQNEWSPLARMKSLSFLPGILATMEARAEGADEGILLNTRGGVAEGTVSNVFVVDGGRLLTPSVASGALPGITRATILELARHAGRDASEGEVAPEELKAADEVFLTNTLMGVMPLTVLDGAPIGDGRPGPATRKLARAYQDLVAKETGGGSGGIGECGPLDFD